MTLGETICRLRKERGMSQGDLADRLGVSRQSVSKWETDGSVPDLDKLVAMSRLFGVTLDQLVCGEEPAEQQKEGPEPPRSPAPVRSRQVVGGVLLGVGLLGLLLLLFFTGLDGLPMGLLFLLPFLLCGTLCLRAKRRLGLWCAWAVYLPQQIYWTAATGITWRLTLTTPYFTSEMNYMRLFVGWLMLAAMVALAVGTAGSFARLVWRPNPGRVVLAGVLWAAALFAGRLSGLVFLAHVGEDGRILLPGMAAGLIQGLFSAGQTAALAAALVLTLALVRGCRSKK